MQCGIDLFCISLFFFSSNYLFYLILIFLWVHIHESVINPVNTLNLSWCQLWFGNATANMESFFFYYLPRNVCTEVSLSFPLNKEAFAAGVPKTSSWSRAKPQGRWCPRKWTYFNRKIGDLLPFSSGASSLSAGIFLSKLSSLCSWNWKKETAERSCCVKEAGFSFGCPSVSGEPVSASRSISEQPPDTLKSGDVFCEECFGKSLWVLTHASCIHQLLSFSLVLENIPGELCPCMSFWSGWEVSSSPHNTELKSLNEQYEHNVAGLWHFSHGLPAACLLPPVSHQEAWGSVEKPCWKLSGTACRDSFFSWLLFKSSCSTSTRISRSSKPFSVCPTLCLLWNSNKNEEGGRWGREIRHEVSCSHSVIQHEICPRRLAARRWRCYAYLSKLLLCIRVNSPLFCREERKK